MSLKTERGKIVPKFTLFWRDGKREVINGSTIAEAMNSVYGGNTIIGLLDFYEDGDCKDYIWDDEVKEWRRNQDTLSF